MSSVFFQAEDGIRDLVRSRGLGDVYKRQGKGRHDPDERKGFRAGRQGSFRGPRLLSGPVQVLSLIHI